jgi:capsular polysaccharide biosynthesis protein
MSIDNSGDINTIILAAGKFNPKNISSGMITDPGLLPIRGKPAINWCIDAAKKNGAGDIKIVLRSSNTRLSRFLGYSYPDVRQIFVGGDDDAATALVSMLGSCNDDMPTQIILGDTLINEPFPEEADVFLASPNIKTSKQWCLATKDENGHLLRIYNKERDISVTGKEALAGYYKFSDTRLLKRLVFEELRAEQPSIINVFLNYNRQVPILIKTTRNWFDFGHISGAVQARLGLFSAREFNNLAVDAVRGTITKISKKKQKLLDEANWYQSLPKEISCYAPRVFDVSEDGEFARVEMELYGYANLAETFIYGSNNLEDWYNIIEALLKVHKVFEKYTETPDRGELEEIYIVKTEQRLAEIAAKYPRIAEMMQSRYLTINSTHYRNYPEFKEDLAAALARLAEYGKRTIVHGDYCFSNILFDPMHYIFKLVDPRGRFRTQTIYGDPRYDIAKLRHSIVGHYDFIVAGLYRLEQNGRDDYEFQISSPIVAEKLEPFFDELAVEYGYDSRDIKLIEGLLFLTMIPLHGDDTNRQRAFYLTAVRKLNEVLYGEQAI